MKPEFLEPERPLSTQWRVAITLVGMALVGFVLVLIWLGMSS